MEDDWWCRDPAEWRRSMQPLGHERYTSLVSTCLDGAASPEQCLELLTHLESCPACAAMWEKWQDVDLLLSTTPLAVPPRSLVEVVAERISQGAPRESRWGWLTVGAALVGVMSLGTGCLALVWFLCWAWRHPLELVGVLSTGAQILSAAIWALAGIGSLIEGISGSGLAALFASCIVVAGSLAVSWVWEVAHAKRSGGPALLTPSHGTRILR